ncbi:MAG: HNH endonuclease [candidate division Zixibacteria bacterium]|nr:HNH endonuclease [candidate division Zixibacteria bacterium]
MELFDYHEETGGFIRKTVQSYNCKIGDRVGNKINKGYVMVAVDNKRYPEHRLVWLYFNGKLPYGQIDHINHIRDDNRIENLRDVPYIENHKNKSMNKNNKSGVAGVSWNKGYGIWQVRIGYKNKCLFLGSYKDFNAAVLTRKVAEFAYGFHPNHGRSLKDKP